MTTILDLRAEPLPLTITVRGHQIAVTYRPDWMTPAHLQAISETTSKSNKATKARDPNAVLLTSLRDMAQMLSDIIASWELCEPDGKTPVPLTSERLEMFGAALLNDFANALAAAVGAKAQAKRDAENAQANKPKPRRSGKVVD